MKDFIFKVKTKKVGGAKFLVVSINDLEYVIAIVSNINKWYELHYYDVDNSVFNINQYYDKDNNLNVVIISEYTQKGYRFRKVDNEFQSPIVIN